MFGIFRKNEHSVKTGHTETGGGFTSVTVDMHSHVLPAIDDGAKTVEDSIVLIETMMACGIKKVIATPHVMMDYYRNTPETIHEALEILKEELDKRNMNIVVEAAAEHYFDELFVELVNKRKLMTMADDHVLFEIPFIGKPHNFEPVLSHMLELNYKPILAHPERYMYLSLPDYKQIKEMQCSLQVNTVSLTGYYGKEVKKKAEQMVENGLVDFISSDMHHARHARAFREAMKNPTVRKLIQKGGLKNSLL